MTEDTKYVLPQLPYGYADLKPYISEEQLKIHHSKHHQAYVNGANALLERMDKARKEGEEFDVKATLKELSFQLGGHILHSLFWSNLSPKGGGSPGGILAEKINKSFGSFEQLRKEFSKAALSVEGSGWAALVNCNKLDRLLIMQIEKHNVNVYPSMKILLVLDLWEHAYYIDYRNDRAKFIEAFWNIVDWSKVEERLGRKSGVCAIQ